MLGERLMKHAPNKSVKVIITQIINANMTICLAKWQKSSPFPSSLQHLW